MSKVLKIYSKSSTYVDKLNFSTNHSKSNTIFCGYKNDSKNKNYFSSIINFSKLNINASLIKTAFLYIYISELNALKEYPTNLYLTSSIENLDISEINYENYKQNIITKPLPINFHSILINSYTKINITQTLKELIQNNTNFNIILNTANDYPTYFLKINSVHSKYAPYIEITLKDSNLNNTVNPTDSLQNTNVLYNDIVKKIDDQNKIIFNISEQLLNIKNLIQEFNESLADITSNNIQKVKSEKNNLKNIIYPTSSNDSDSTNTKSAITIVNKNNNSRVTLIKSKDNK